MDLKEIIEKLNSIDAKDLQNIDMDQIKMGMQSRPDILLNVIVVFLSLIIAFYQFHYYKKTRQDLSEKQRVMEEKIDAIKTKDATQTALDQFMESFPEATPLDGTISQLSATANKNGLDVQSIVPDSMPGDDYQTLKQVELVVQADSFEDMIRFTDEVENWPLRVRTNSWQYIPGRSFSFQSDQEQKIKAMLTLTVYDLKDE